MFPKAACPFCSRSTAVTASGSLRAHFCPHRRFCEPDGCTDCATELVRARQKDERRAEGLAPARLAGGSRAALLPAGHFAEGWS